MTVREAILAAARKIETDPQGYKFFSYGVPASDTGTACALGWIGFHLGLPWRSTNHEVAEQLGFECTGPFYARMNKLCSGEFWTDEPTTAAAVMREYADLYHSETSHAD